MPRVSLFGGIDQTGQGLKYGTFLGGLDDDSYGRVKLAIGPDGSKYVAGTTFSADFPTTPGAFDRTFNGSGDVYVSKLDPSGSNLIYSTFLGGNGLEDLWSVEVGADGAVYVGGLTASPNFPTTPGAFDTTYEGGDGFITKIDPQGSALVYSTFLGGSVSEKVTSLALSGDGTVFATGETFSEDFPTTPGAFDTCDHGRMFVSALNPAGSDLVYSTCLAGNGTGYGIALGPAGTAYVTGRNDNLFPTTPGAFDRTYNGGGWDVVVAQINAQGSALLYSTFVGGGDDDESTAIEVDGAGNAYLVGFTHSANYPTTPGAYDRTINSTINPDILVTKLNPVGGALVYSTFLGGNDFDSAHGLALDSDGFLAVVGETSSPNFPTTPGAYDRTLGGSGDAVVCRLNRSGSRLVYGSFLGGTLNGSEGANAIAQAGPGAVSVAGATPSSDFPTTPGAYDRTFNGGVSDAFVATLRVARTAPREPHRS